MRLTARVPATVANLGPGFDCFALAVDLANEITVDTDAEPSVTVEGEGADELPADRSNLVVRSMVAVAGEVGRALPPVAVSCVNRIPLERGLGSSSAATVGGVILADRLLGAELGGDGLLRLAAQIEGHADNVAAALQGGVILVFATDDGWGIERLDPARDVRPVLLVPENERVNTAEARRVLPAEVSRRDASFNASRTALLALALSARSDLLAVAMEDRLHQDARLQLAPASRELFDRLTGKGIPVCVAGSGPSLLAFDVAGMSVADPGKGWRVIRPDIAPGARIISG